LTNPTDVVSTVICNHIAKLTGNESLKKKVVGSGGLIDTSRAELLLCKHVKDKLNKEIQVEDTSGIHTIAQHGIYMVMPSLNIKIAGTPIRDFLTKNGVKNVESFIEEWAAEVRAEGTRIARETSKPPLNAPATEVAKITSELINVLKDKDLSSLFPIDNLHVYNEKFGIVFGTAKTAISKEGFVDIGHDTPLPLTQKESETYHSAIAEIKKEIEAIKNFTEVSNILESSESGLIIRTDDYGYLEITPKVPGKVSDLVFNRLKKALEENNVKNIEVPNKKSVNEVFNMNIDIPSKVLDTLRECLPKKSQAVHRNF
jgi:malate/lactate dehydrogenase